MDGLKRLKEELDGLRKKAYDQDAINDAVYNGVKLHKEPVSDGFEEEVRKYAPIYYKDNDISKFARHFANWQKEKDDKLLEDHIVYKNGKLAGMRFMKQLLFRIREKEKMFSEYEYDNFDDEFAKTLAERKEILPKDSGFSDLDLYNVALHFSGWQKRKMIDKTIDFLSSLGRIDDDTINNYKKAMEESV